MTTIIRNAVIADRIIVEAMPRAAFKVASWDNRHSPATQKAVEEWCAAHNLITERSYRSAGRYWLFIYHNTETGRRTGRLNCFASTEGAL